MVPGMDSLVSLDREVVTTHEDFKILGDSRANPELVTKERCKLPVN